METITLERKILTTTLKISIGLILTVLCACNSSTTQQDGSTMSEMPNNYVSSISMVDGEIKIDTNAILNNRNLLPLIEDLEKVNLTEKNSIDSMPIFIKNFLDSITGNFSIANPGEDWQSGCTPQLEIDNSTQKRMVDHKTGDTIYTASMKVKDMPPRKLIYFGLGDNLALITYFTGGYFTSEHILILKFSNNEIVDFWCGNIMASVSDKDEVLKYLKCNINKAGELNTNVICL